MTDPRSRLREWQRDTLEQLQQTPVSGPCRNDVTGVAHWFWDDDRFDADAFTLFSALLMVKVNCGSIPVVLVANRASQQLETFCTTNGISLVVDRALKPGLPQLNAEYIGNLHRRFDTRYCMVVQNDGFPVRSGLNDFVGPYDYVGAPWNLNDDWITRPLFRGKWPVGNGGFSLRSRELCERAAWYYRRWYKLIPFCYLVVDDIFICRVLQTFEPQFRQEFVFAPVPIAARFSLERDVQRYRSIGGLPFGFHGADAFALLMDDGHLFPSGRKPSH